MFFFNNHAENEAERLMQNSIRAFKMALEWLFKGNKSDEFQIKSFSSKTRLSYYVKL